MVHIVNSYSFNSLVYNYTAHFKFLWDKIQIHLRFESDMKVAKIILLEVARKHPNQYIKETVVAWGNLEKRYKLENASKI